MVTQKQARFGMNNIKITGEAASADGEAPATFLTELNKWIRVWCYLWFQGSRHSLGDLGVYPPQIRVDYI